MRISSFIFKKLFWVILLLSIVSLSALATSDNTTQERYYKIPATSLELALNNFGRQAGILLSFDPAVVRGFTSLELDGRYTPIVGIRKLVSATNLVVIPIGNGGFRIQNTVDSGVTVLPTVQVSASNDNVEKAYQAPVSASYISEKEIQRFRGSSVGDIFQGESGVLIAENRNSGGININVRGMQGQGRVPVLVDGSRQETTVWRGYAGVTSRSYVDPDLVAGIDIKKGPVMSAQATGAIGGLVNMRTLEAGDLIKGNSDVGVRLKLGAISNTTNGAVASGTSSGLNPIASNGGSYRINCVVDNLCRGNFDLDNAYGSEDTLNRPSLFNFKSWNGSLAMTKRFDTFDIVAAYAQREQGNYYAGKDGPVPSLDISNQIPRGFWTEVRPKVVGASRFRANELVVNSNYKSTSSLIKGIFFLSDEEVLKLGWQNYDSTYGELMPSQLIWLGQARQTSGSKVGVDTYTARYSWQSVAHDWIDLEANLWHTDTESNNRNYSDDIQFGFSEIESYKRWGLDVSNITNTQHWQYNYGFALQYEEIDTQPSDTQQSIVGRSGERREFSAFVDVAWNIVKQLRLNAGLRYTSYYVEDHNPIEIQPQSQYCRLLPGTDSQCETLRYNDDFSGVAPLLSLTWEFSPNLQFYARYAKALRMPSLFESSSGFSTQPSPDSYLEPEQAKNKELGFNMVGNDLLIDKDRLLFKLAYFRNFTEDYLTRTIPNHWEDSAQYLFFVTRNVDSVELHGAELSGEYDAKHFFTKFSVTHYQHIEVCHYGSLRRQRCNDYGIANSYINNMIPPNEHASLTLGSRWFDEKLELGARLTWMGKRNPTPEYDNATAIGVAGAQPIAWHSYKLLDLFASYKINDSINIDFNVDNLTDQYYLDALSLGLVASPGRTARLGLTISY